MKIWVWVLIRLLCGGDGATAMVSQPCPREAQLTAQRLSYFCDTYEACRKQFLRAVQARQSALPSAEATRVQRGSWRVPSKTDPNLVTDWAYFPARGTPQRLVLVTSGTHGVEGFMGSAVQRYFLEELLGQADRDHTGYLFVHAINPFGFKYQRRVTENNVDLNRNFDVSRTLFDFDNVGYRNLAWFLNPRGPARYDYWSGSRFFFNAAQALVVEKVAALRSAILRGQYHDPKGIYFGGQDFEPQKAPLDALLMRVSDPYRAVMHWDIHTGFGSSGHLHLFPSAIADPQTRANLTKVFGDYPIDEGSDEEGDFYVTTGEFSHYVMQRMLLAGKVVVPMVIEYGTTDNQSTLGGLQSLRLSVLENQLQRFGGSPVVQRRVRRDFLAQYYPSSRPWRLQVMSATADWLPRFLQRFSKL